MILTYSDSLTELLNPTNAAKLRECDDITRYNECGWHCATGYKDERVHVRVHAHTREDLDYAIDPDSAKWNRTKSMSRYR